MCSFLCAVFCVTFVATTPLQGYVRALSGGGAPPVARMSRAPVTCVCAFHASSRLFVLLELNVFAVAKFDKVCPRLTDIKGLGNGPDLSVRDQIYRRRGAKSTAGVLQ